MKKVYYLSLLFAAVCSTSCGASKKALEAQNQMLMMQMRQQGQSQYQQQGQQPGNNAVVEQEVQLSECEKMSFDLSDGKLRSFGTAIDPDPDFARQQAIALAKGQLTQDMQALVKNVIDIYRSKTGLNKVSSNEDKREQHIQVVSENMMSNNTVLRTAKFMRNDGTCRYEACVGSVELAEKVVEKVLSSDQELKVAYDKKMYEESYQEGLNRFRELREQK